MWLRECTDAPNHAFDAVKITRLSCVGSVSRRSFLKLADKSDQFYAPFLHGQAVSSEYKRKLAVHASFCLPMPSVLSRR